MRHAEKATVYERVARVAYGSPARPENERQCGLREVAVGRGQSQKFFIPRQISRKKLSL